MPIWFGRTAIGVIAVIDIVWTAFGSFTVIAAPILIALTVGVAIIAVVSARRYRLLAQPVEAMMQNIIAAHVLLVLVYICMSRHFPLWDDALNRADAALGFDWLKWHDRIVASPFMHRSFFALYVIIYFGQLTFAMLVLPFISVKRSTEFVVAFCITLGVSSIVAMLMPSLGPIFDFHRMDENLHGGIVHLTYKLIAIRSASNPVLNYTDLNSGLMMFPSFHAASVV